MTLLIGFVAGAVVTSVSAYVLHRLSAPPLPTSLAALQVDIARIEGAHTAMSQALDTRLGDVLDVQRQLADGTVELAKVYGNSHTRGNWGEVTLRNICEAAGLSEHVDFTTQAAASGVGVDDRGVRPDVVVHLPGGAHLCIDSKFPGGSFDPGPDADAQKRKQALKDHVSRMRGMIDDLAAKRYWAHFPHSPNVVVMFVPSEAAFAAAVSYAPDLIERAAAKNVALATPATMLAFLKLVGLGWQEATVVANAEQIRAASLDLATRLGSFATHLKRMGIALNGTRKEFNSAVGVFDDELLPAARRLGDLGLPNADDIAGPAGLNTPATSPAQAA